MAKCSPGYALPGRTGDIGGLREARATRAVNSYLATGRLPAADVTCRA
ncbi:hypothetical protein [Streptomyces graminofaciens]|nr:hypothetical protein [Streptomyces graminofaciens]